MDTTQTPTIVFNSSLPRSGSTLLQNILAQNPRFHCSPTSGVLEMLLAARNIYAGAVEFKGQDPQVVKKGFISFCRDGVRGYYRGVSDRPVCVDKCRGWLNYYEWLAEAFPSPRILICVRDLRAILSSMEKLWRKNKHRGDPQDNP